MNSLNKLREFEFTGWIKRRRTRRREDFVSLSNHQLRLQARCVRSVMSFLKENFRERMLLLAVVLCIVISSSRVGCIGAFKLL